MFVLRALASLVFLSLLLPQAGADTVTYQGRLTVDGKLFHGAGQFRFALVGGDGTVLWSTNNVDLLVREGVYTARLGDPAAGMPPLPGGVLQHTPALRIWFNEHAHGWQQAGGDVPLKGAATKAAGAEISGAQAAAILAELREVRALLGQSHPSPGAETAPQFVTVSMGEGPTMGKADAPLVLVEFIDFQCGPSQIYQTDIFPALVSNYIDTGKLRLVTRHLPHHAQSEPGARAAVCAHQQGKFWEAREKLFALGANLTPEAIARVARDSVLDQARFDACFSSKEAGEIVQADFHDAQFAGIAQTPSFVLGRAEGGKVTGLLLTGVVPLGTWEAEIYKLLTTPAAAKKP